MYLKNKSAPYINRSNFQWVPGTLSRESKQTKLEAPHSPPYSVDIKHAYSYSSTLPYVHMTRCWIQHTHNCTNLHHADILSCSSAVDKWQPHRQSCVTCSLQTPLQAHNRPGVGFEGWFSRKSDPMQPDSLLPTFLSNLVHPVSG